MTKVNLIQFVLSIFMVTVLLTGCDMKAPVADRNADVSDSSASAEKTDAADTEDGKIDSAVSDAANELIPECNPEPSNHIDLNPLCLELLDLVLRGVRVCYDGPYV